MSAKDASCRHDDHDGRFFFFAIVALVDVRGSQSKTRFVIQHGAADHISDRGNLDLMPTAARTRDWIVGASSYPKQKGFKISLSIAPDSR